jgi:hypothetical protein
VHVFIHPSSRAGRHIFVQQAFLADTEDWRSNALIGNANSPIARMNIINPRDSTYLEESSERRMSYSRQKSLSRAISYRQTLVKHNGELADSQYTDQYLDKETVMSTLRRQSTRQERQSVVFPDADTMDQLGRYWSCYTCDVHRRNTWMNTVELHLVSWAIGWDTQALHSSHAQQVFRQAAEQGTCQLREQVG